MAVGYSASVPAASLQPVPVEPPASQAPLTSAAAPQLRTAAAAPLPNPKMARPVQSGAAPEAWPCEESTKMRDYSDKCHSVYDSGCISGANLSSDLSLSEDLSTRSSRPCSFTDIPAESVVSDSKSYNREDSGLDLAEPFSGLSLEYNDLGKQPSQCQTTLPKCNVPTVESTTVLPQDNSLSLQALEHYQQNEDGDTELHLAVVEGFIEAVNALVRMAVHPHLLNIQNYDGQTALHLAVLTGQTYFAKRLVRAGASLAPRDAYGNTALHLVAETGDVECLQAMLAAAADAGRPVYELETRNYDGMMCVHVAAARGHQDVLRCLISAGANLNARDAKSGRTVLHLAVELGRRDVVHLLLEEAPQLLQMEATTYAGLTAYQLAVCYDAVLADRLAVRGACRHPFPEDDSSDEEEEKMSWNYHHQLNFLGGPINASA